MHKYFVSLLVLIQSTIVTAQTTTMRYKDDMFNVAPVQTVEYATVTNYFQQQETLHADIYTPANDSNTQRAFIIYMHGGGFRAGRRNDSSFAALCYKLAKKGYVTASLDYRLGFDETNPASQQQAILNAVQDLNAFIRYAKANADTFGIDTSKIFISGSSAGAIAVLTKAYIKLDTAAAALGITDTTQIEGTANLNGHNSSVTAAFSMWGALYDTLWMQPNDIPVGCVHSRGDNTIPFVSGYNRNDPAHKLYGSQSIYNRAKNIGLLTDLYAYNSSKHDLGLKVQPYADTTTQLVADFFYAVINHQAQVTHNATTFIPIQKAERGIAGLLQRLKILLRA